MLPPYLALWAIHLPDGYLNLDWSRPLEGWPWIIGGFLGMAILAYWGARRIRDEEIPRIALLTAAFTVASAVHVPLGPSSVHPLLNGLLGVVLGRRAALAIPIGLLLQAVAGHGGFTTLGINSCVMVVPALFAAALVQALDSIAVLRFPWVRSSLIGGCAVLWVGSVAFGAALLRAGFKDAETLHLAVLHFRLWLPYTLAAAALVSVPAIWMERRFGNSPEFVLGFLVGGGALLLSVALSGMVMFFGGPNNQGARLFALLVFIAHLPLAPAEGLVAGFLLAYLARVKPEMIRPAPGVPIPEKNGEMPRPALALQQRGTE